MPRSRCCPPSTRVSSGASRRRYDLDFQLRIGINTGPVLVGNVGSDLKYEYTALGDAVNVAARMQNAADPGTVLVTAATYRFVSGLVDVRDIGALEVKGKSEPVQAYEVLGLKAQPDVEPRPGRPREPDGRARRAVRASSQRPWRPFGPAAVGRR